MSVKVSFETATTYLDTFGDLGDALDGITYIFVESDVFQLPTDPIGLISWRDSQVDCVLTAQTWKFPLTMDKQNMLEMVTVLVANEVTARLP